MRVWLTKDPDPSSAFSQMCIQLCKANGRARPQPKAHHKNKKFTIGQSVLHLSHAQALSLVGYLGDLYAESVQTLQGSFSAVSTQILQVSTRWKALAEIYTMHSFAPLSTTGNIFFVNIAIIFFY